MTNQRTSPDPAPAQNQQQYNNQPCKNKNQNQQNSNSDIPESSNTNHNIPTFSYYTDHIIADGIKACQQSILGKIITDKTIHTSSIQNGLESIWGSPPGLKIQEIEGHILQFYMDNAADQERILLGNPWIFRNSWLIVKPWDRETDPRTLDFDHVPVWIQLWGLPAHCKTKAMGMHLGAVMGDVEASELYEYPGKKMIIKIKVAINVHKPIPSGIHVGNPIDGTCWVDFRYEKLPQVCFHCGLIGHADKLCRNQGLNMDTMAPLGPWIISTQYGRRKMEERDRKYYSNPSQSPNFGTYSPPVPASLLAQLAAMKVQQTSPKDPGCSTQQKGQKNDDRQYKGTGNGQHSLELLNEKGSRYYKSGNQQGGTNLLTNTGHLEDMDWNLAKKLKMTNEVTNEIQPMAGLEFQASQQP
jgi:hypothetical protein